MSDPQDIPAALDDIADADEQAGDAIDAEHDLDVDTFTQEVDVNE